MSNPNLIPEEVQMIATLMGQAHQIDSMVLEKNPQLVTDGNIKRGLDDFIAKDRARQIAENPALAPPPSANPNSPPQLPPGWRFDSYGVPVPDTGQSIPQHQVFNPQIQVQFPPPVDDGQLELNLTPNHAELMVKFLKEISQKLTKQNSLIQKLYDATHGPEKGTSIPIVKLGKG